MILTAKRGTAFEQKILKQDVFGYLWDAVRFCETVDLDGLITKE